MSVPSNQEYKSRAEWWLSRGTHQQLIDLLMKYDDKTKQIAQLQSELGETNELLAETEAGSRENARRYFEMKEQLAEAKAECERLKGAVRLYECRCAFGMGTLTTWTHTAECVAMQSAMKD